MKLIAERDAAIAAIAPNDADIKTAADKLATQRHENALVSGPFQELKKVLLTSQKKWAKNYALKVRLALHLESVRATNRFNLEKEQAAV